MENFTWHCLRHTFASRMVMAGVDLRTVGELLGHKTMAMTMRYSHLSAEHKARAVASIESTGASEAGILAYATGNSADTRTDTGPQADFAARRGIFSKFLT